MPRDQYFNNMPEDQRLKAQSVHKLILDLFPQSKVNLKYKMPTYEAEKGRQSAIRRTTGRSILVVWKRFLLTWQVILK
jgi:hypothetical protein